MPTPGRPPVSDLLTSLINLLSFVPSHWLSVLSDKLGPGPLFWRTHVRDPHKNWVAPPQEYGPMTKLYFLCRSITCEIQQRRCPTFEIKHSQCLWPMEKLSFLMTPLVSHLKLIACAIKRSAVVKIIGQLHEYQRDRNEIFFNEIIVKNYYVTNSKSTPNHTIFNLNYNVRLSISQKLRYEIEWPYPNYWCPKINMS